jgi:hypothetical protein
VRSARATTWQARSDELSSPHDPDGRCGSVRAGALAVSLVPVPSEPDRASCPNCSAPLAPDQRYCLTCGQPASPVRLAFLDVLQPDSRQYAGVQGSVGSLPASYAPTIESSSGWMRRYTGLFGLLSVLLMSIIVGLLVGHWVTQNRATGPQVIKVEGLPAAAATAAPSATTTTAASTTPNPAAANKTSAKTEAKEVKEAKAIEKAPLPKPVKLSPAKLKKLSSTSGQKHAEEVSSLGDQPVESK